VLNVVANGIGRKTFMAVARHGHSSRTRYAARDVGNS